MPETVREILYEAHRALNRDGPRNSLRVLIEAVEKLLEDVERQEARIKELENWRTS